MNIAYPLKAVTVKKLAELSGYSEGALRKKIHDQVFKEGVQYCRSPDGRIMCLLEGINTWVLNGQRG
jgi:hypothetical protein